jgi:uncharacterized membrane protein YeaQ/YmgE (transglycosylase-associated protein family)
MSNLIAIVVFGLFFTAFGWLAVHHFRKVRRGLRTGMIEGLALGFADRKYSRTEQPGAFWLNVFLGLFGASVGAFVVFDILLILGSAIAAYEGYPTL